jgi:hypothetical protein
VIVPTTPAPFRLDVALASVDRLTNFNPQALYYSHFGKADRAVERLYTYEQQLELWTQTAKRGIDNNEDLETIAKKILEADPAIRKAVDFVRVHPILGETVFKHSVQGVVEFVRKFGCA